MAQETVALIALLPCATCSLKNCDVRPAVKVLMHLGIKVNNTVFCHFFEQVLESNSSFEARII